MLCVSSAKRTLARPKRTAAAAILTTSSQLMAGLASMKTAVIA
jgi:hypothetical protein